MWAFRLIAFPAFFAIVSIGAGHVVAGQFNENGGRNAAQAVEKIPRKRQKSTRPEPIEIGGKEFAYIRANLISTLYHEFAHALVDKLDLPVYGQEEDAADVMAVIMLDYQHGGGELEEIAYLTAEGFRDEALDHEESGHDWVWADVHGPEWQRYYNFVCLHFGSSPEKRLQFAEDMGLPEDRAETCEDESAMARRSWGAVIDRIKRNKAEPGAGETIVFESHVRRGLHRRSAEVISKEVARLNHFYRLPSRLRVTVRRCGDDSTLSAFYTEGRSRITICTEYISELYRRAQAASDL